MSRTLKVVVGMRSGGDANSGTERTTADTPEDVASAIDGLRHRLAREMGVEPVEVESILAAWTD